MKKFIYILLIAFVTSVAYSCTEENIQPRGNGGAGETQKY